MPTWHARRCLDESARVMAGAPLVGIVLMVEMYSHMAEARGDDNGGGRDLVFCLRTLPTNADISRSPPPSAVWFNCTTLPRNHPAPPRRAGRGATSRSPHLDPCRTGASPCCGRPVRPGRGVGLAPKGVLIKDSQGLDGRDAAPAVRQQVDGRHGEVQQHPPQLLQRRLPVQSQQQAHHAAEVEGVVATLVHRDQPQQARQGRVAPLVQPPRQVTVVDPCRQLVHHRVNEHPRRSVMR